MTLSLALVLSVEGVLQDIAAYLHLDLPELTRRSLQVVGIWLLAWAAWRLVRYLAGRIERAVDDGDPSVVTMREKRGQTISQLLRSVGRVVILVLAVLLSLNIFINIGPLLAGAGIIGLAVSFGAQSLVKDVISGFFMLLEDQISVGDIVELGGKGGVVERMTMRVVVLRDVYGTVHIIPNGEITTVSNKTRGWARAVIDVGVGYEADLDHALEVFRDEAARFAEDPTWKVQLDGPPEIWGVEALADSGVVIRAVLRTVPGSQWNVGREFRRRIKLRLAAEGIDIPYPQRTLHVRMHDPRLAALPGSEDQP